MTPPWTRVMAVPILADDSMTPSSNFDYRMVPEKDLV